jgi:hypothetical protein
MKRLLLVVAIAGCGGGSVGSGTIAAACAAANACMIQSVPSVSSCTSVVSSVNDPALQRINGVQDVSASQVKCVADAGSNCNNVRKCLNDGTPPSPCNGTGAIQCMGNTLIRCSDLGNGTFGTASYDCTINGEMCVAASNNLGCGIGTCSRDGGTCMGDLLQNCSGGILSNLDCSHFYATCVTTGFAHCRGKGPGCQQPNPLNAFGDGIRCDGNTLVVCLDGQEASYDCGKIGTSCFANANQSGNFGCSQGADCNPNNYTETCTGGTLTFCNDGKVDTYNCTAHGYSACNASNNHGCVM